MTESTRPERPVAPPIPAVIYAVRSAADDRDEQEKSTTSQVKEIRARIKSEGGREIVADPFTESGRSGYHGNRGEQLEAAMAMAEATADERGGCELWVFATNRLGRGSGRKDEARSVQEVLTRLQRAGVAVRSADDDEFARNPMLWGIAGELAHKYAKDHGAHVARGKRAAVLAGKWGGGPAPDGYVLEAELDERGNRTTRLVIDPAREPVILALFDMAADGIGASAVARRMNAAGHRTKTGKPWTGRRVQSALANPVYAGRVVRRGKGSIKGKTYEALDSPEQAEGLHEAIIDPERFDRLQADRRARDRSAGGRARAAERDKGGRPTTRYALAKLAVCDRCGERMYATTSPYKRKDGSQARRYVCANVRFSTGLCDQPQVDAEKVDTAVVRYMGDLFIDYEAFVAELSRGSDEQARAARLALDAALEEIDVLDTRAERIEADYLRQMDAGDSGAADFAARMVERTRAERADAERRAGECRAALDAIKDEPANAALDAFNDLRHALRGAEGRGLAEVNERLRSEFDEFRIDTMPEGVVGVQPVLKPRTFDVHAAFREWVEAGSPPPTADEVEAADAEERAGQPLWVRGREQIRPPAKVLVVPDPNLPYSQP